MNNFKKISAALLVLFLLVAAIAPVAIAATDAKVQPGETAKVTLDLGKVYGINGEFTISNETDFTVTLSGDGILGKTCYFYSRTTEPTQLTYTATVVAKDSAKDGATCTITLNYEDWGATGDDEQPPQRSISKTVVVEIPGSDEPTEPKPTEPTEPKPTTPSTPSTKPTAKADYTELNKQIKLANGLTPNGYTAESWQNVMDALKKANDALSSKDQATIDKAAADLAAAIAALEGVDYSKLEQAIDKAETLLDSTDLNKAFNDLFKGLEEGKALLNSNEQAAVDAAAQNIEDLIVALEKALAALDEQEEPSTPVEPEPAGKYCNIPMHYVWPILFFISLALNIVFVVVLVLRAVKRKKNEEDNTPLVNYDIGEDA